jgi:serine O-acetyltransferase
MQYLKAVPSEEKIKSFYQKVRQYIFPVAQNDDEYLAIKKQLEGELKPLFIDIIKSLNDHTDRDLDALEETFIADLNEVKGKLLKDAQAMYEFDPAANSVEEVIMTYIGFKAIVAYRIAHELHELNIPILPRMISEMAHSETGVDIHPGATIGCPFLIDHGTGVVVGETAIIGENVKLYQGVTIGALAVSKEEEGKKRHPTIEDNVIIYANSTVLGGRTVLGNDSIIGGNCFVTSSVPSFSMVYHKPIISVKDTKNFEEPINFVI